MQRYIGIDAHASSCTIAVMGPSARRLREQRVQTHGRALRKPVLKDVFVGAADYVISHSPSHPLHQDYQQRLEQGTRPPVARLTIARRIAAAVLAMWKHQQDYGERFGEMAY